MRTLKATRYVLIGAIILMIAALIAWYVFLRSEQSELAAVDQGRGAGINAPTFGGGIGSTFENVAASFGLSGENRDTTGAPPRLLNIARSPVSGVGFATLGTTTGLLMLERSTGNLLTASTEQGTLERRTNTLIQDVFETIVLKSGKVIVRSVDAEGRIITTVGEVTATSSATSALAQTRLPDGIRAIAGSPDGNEIFYIIESGEGAVGIRARFDGTNQRELFSSALAGWRVQWPSDDRIVLVQRASDGVPGYAFTINDKGAIASLIRNIPGLTLLAHRSEDAFLYGSASGALALYAKVGEASAVLLPVRTVADKCVWAPSSAKATEGRPASLVAYCAVPQSTPPPNFLDAWYRGEAHTSDTWWRVDVSAATAEQLFPAGSIAIDVEEPTIDANGEYIAFRNAIDKSPWLLRIKE